jgi:hypothetical protein
LATIPTIITNAAITAKMPNPIPALNIPAIAEHDVKKSKTIVKLNSMINFDIRITFIVYVKFK